MDLSTSDALMRFATAPARLDGAPGPIGTSLTVEIDRLAPETWDRLIGDFDDLALEQTACYADGHWGPTHTSHLVLRRDGRAAADARVALMVPPGLRHGLAYVRFGPFWRRCDAAPDPSLYRALIGALIEEYCIRRGHCLSVIPRPHPVYHDLESGILAEHGFVVRRPCRDANRYLVDLSLDEAAQMQSFEQKWRYNLRQALKNGVEVRLCEGERSVATFTALHEVMVKRKRYCSGDPLHLLPDLALRLPVRMRPQLILAFHGGRPVFGAVVMIMGDTAYYVFGASDDGALPLKASYALHWWVVRWLANSGVRWYDLGGEVQEPGLRQFKKGFVGKRGTVVVMHGEHDRWVGLRGRVVADTIYGLRAARRTLRNLCA